MSRKISINQLSPRLQRQVKQAVASLTKKSSVTLASKQLLNSDEQWIEDFDSTIDLIRYFERYLKSTASKSQFTKDVKFIVDVVEKQDADMEPEIQGMEFIIEQDRKGNYECALEVSVHIRGNKTTFRDFQLDLASALSNRLKICKYQKDEFLGVDVFDEDDEDEAANGSLRFTIASDLVNVDLES